MKELIQAIGRKLDREFTNNGFEIAHAKLMGLDMVDDQFVKGNKTSRFNDWRWQMNQGKLISNGMIFVNFRIVANPQTLLNVVKQGVQKVCEKRNIDYKLLRMESFSPSRPVPTYPRGRIID